MELNNRAFILLIVGFPALLTLAVMMMQRGGPRGGVSWILQHPFEALLNYVIAFALINILLFLSGGNLYLYFSIGIVMLFSVLAYISHLKTQFRGEPLSVLDIKLLNEAVNISEGFVADAIGPVLVLIITSILAFALIFLFIKAKVTKAVRFPIAIISALILVISLSVNIDAFYKIKVTIPADVTWNHDENGFLLATLIDSKFLKIPEPEGYSEQAIADIYQKMQGTKVSTANKEKDPTPNVLFVMSESFSDFNPSLGLDIKLNQNPTPFFTELSKETLSGHIEVPGVGGGTANTEYEVLTGLTRKFFPEYAVPYNPYNSYIHQPVQSLAHTFSDLGYYTTAIHPYQSWFYRRNEVYKHLGFDRFTSIETLAKVPETEGLFTTDGETNALMIDQMKKTPERDFIYTVTMEGHGPYADMTVKNKTINVQQEGLSENASKVLSNYLNLMNDVDRHFEGLITELKTFDEPTVVVYFGDHIPPLGNDVYEELKFNMYSENSKRTPMLIWSNYEDFAEDGVSDGELEMNANLLGSYVLDLIGVNNEPYMNYLSELSETAPLLKPTGENENLLADFELLQYDIMHGKRYIYRFIGEPQASEQYSIGEPLKLEGIAVTEVGRSFLIELLGKGITTHTAMFLNDEKYPSIASDRLMTVIPKKELEAEQELTLSAKMLDSREKVIQASTPLAFKSIDDMLAKAKDNPTGEWQPVKLSAAGDHKWEFFSKGKGFKTVRLNLDLKEVPYFVTKNGEALKNANADTFDAPDLSDIYPNGYLYVSVADQESGWSENVSMKGIEEYFKENQYILYKEK